MEVQLHNGVAMPSPGFGTGAIRGWQVDNDEVVEVVGAAIAAGYRHLDTASMYGNERSVGRAIKGSGVARDALFVVTKAWNTECGYEQILRAFDNSQRRLDLEYLDLYLLHWPVPDLIAESWRAMERLHDEGRVRAIGVSNFRISDLELVLATAEVTPVCNQVEIHPYFSQPELAAFCRARDIQVVSYSPLGTGAWSGIPNASKPVADPVIAEIAGRHAVTPAQVILRWNLQHGWVPIPKSEDPVRMRQNIELQGFVLSNGEMHRIDALDTGQRFNVDPGAAIAANMQMAVPD
ncbi:MAG: aldo/keto reductase [Gammaproteobacteria bacterium]|nr:aldo/keto reductase [Gammaproteobacteria bacterium]